MKDLLLTSLQKLHGVDDGMVSVYAEGHQDIGRSIEQYDLKIERAKPMTLAGLLPCY
jgi:hypothetical protein